MKEQPTTFKLGAQPRFLRPTFNAGLLASLVLLLSIQSSRAGSATWLATPASGDWNTAGNWTAGGPPNGSADTATFAFSSITGIANALNTEVNGIVFNTGGSAFTITASPSFTLTISGAGMTNNSGTTQNFVADIDAFGNFGTIAFTNSATAGSLTAFTANGSTLEGAPGGAMQFSDTSTASNGTFTINGGDGAPDACGTQGGTMQFSGTSTAGNGIFTINAATAGCYLENPSGGLLEFLDSSTADNGTFLLNAGTAGGSSGPAVVEFFGTSTAGNGTFTVVGGTTGDGAQMVFHDSSTAGTGVFTITVAPGQYGGAGIAFYDTSTPGNATFTLNGSDGSNGSTAIGNAIYLSSTAGAANAIVIANGGLNGGSGGTIHIAPTFSTGSTARIEVFGNGTGDFTNGTMYLGQGQQEPPVTIGSIEGNGVVWLGGDSLIVGSNNLSTTFSGLMQDGPFFGTGGSLTKIGNGKLTLSKANTYTGGTTVSKGTLLVTNRTGSATGTGPVQVNKGTVGGTGKISGAVTISSGRSAAVLAPGSGARPGTLTILSTLTFNSHATYKIDLNSSTVTADKVFAKGVTITSGALVSIGDLGTGALTAGTVFTVINNTAGTPIAGTFSNLADNSTVIVGINTYLVSYQGGTGNDLTLTVQ